MIIVLNSLSDRLLICLIKVLGESFALLFGLRHLLLSPLFACLFACMY